MTAKFAVTDDQLITYYSRLRELTSRVHRGDQTSVLDLDKVNLSLQSIIESKTELAIPSIKQFDKPDWIKKLTKDVKVSPGTYTLSFEEFLNEGEEYVVGDVMVRRANASGAISGLQHALWLLDNQALIPTEYKGQKYLVFAGTEALDSDGHRDVPCLRWIDDEWVLHWYWLGLDFYRLALLVRARKS